MMIYHLNNIRLKGRGKRAPEVDKKLPTYLLASGDLVSGYVFRSDIAYDWDISLEDIERDTLLHHSDHSYPFLRRLERLRYPFAPQPPTDSDWQNHYEYLSDNANFQRRKDYVEGSHVKSQYTATAHYWLLKKMLNSEFWYFVSDDDATLQSSILRVFSDLVRKEQAHYITCTYNKTLELDEAGRSSFINRTALER